MPKLQEIYNRDLKFFYWATNFSPNEKRTENHEFHFEDFYLDFVVPFCQFLYCLETDKKNQIKTNKIMHPNVCMFSQVVGGAGTLISMNRRHREIFQIMTARHVISNARKSIVGFIKIAFLDRKVLLLKCFEEMRHPQDLAWMEIVCSLDIENYQRDTQLPKINYKIVMPKANDLILTYGYPSILYMRNVYGAQKYREGPEKMFKSDLFREKQVNYITWEPPMWNTETSDNTKIPKGSKSKNSFFYHDALKYGGFSGGPLFTGNSDQIEINCLVGLHHGWDDVKDYGIASYFKWVHGAL